MSAPGIVIARQLERQWTDDNGRPFNVRMAGLYDAHAGIMALNNFSIVDTLSKGEPLIIGAGGHAMVLTAIDALQTPGGPAPQAGGVFDPWPGKGSRALSPAEMLPMHLGGSLQFLVKVIVS